MKSILKTSCVVLSCALIAISAMEAQRPAEKKSKFRATSLTGVWQGNDGGTYQIRQEGTKVWWYGRSANNGADWQNSFFGVITNDQLVGDWADLPPGGMQNAGSLQILIEAGRLTRQDGTGGFGGSAWVPASGMPVTNAASVGNLAAELNNINPRSGLPDGYRATRGGGNDKADSAVELPQSVINWFDTSAPMLEGILRKLAGDEGVNQYLDWEQSRHPNALQRVDLRLKAINTVVH